MQVAQVDQSNVGSALLLIWGGQRLALGRIHFSHRGSFGQHVPCLVVIGPEYKAADWILDASFAVPHHPQALAYCVTAHNDVFVLRLTPSLDLSFGISQVTSGLSAILYSASIKPISSSTVLVAAGTVFGEVIVWSCYQSKCETAEARATWHSRTSHVFHGHSGSIFGVCFSEIVRLNDNPGRLLASCSDDRTIRLWDVTGCDQIPESAEGVSSQHHGLFPQAGPESISDASIATTWGHVSRIWDVNFIHSNSGSSDMSLQLISRGEDATCQLWQLAWKEATAPAGIRDPEKRYLQFHHMGIDHYHSGKHIWSVVHHLGHFGPLIYTGGGDGGIIARSATAPKFGDTIFSIQTPFCELLKNINPDSARYASISNNHHDSVKQYVFTLGSVILATTNQGHLIQGTINADEQNPGRPLSITWTVRFSATDLRAFTVMTSKPTESMVYIGSVTGKIWVYHVALQSIQLLSKTDQKISRIFTGTSSARKNGSMVRHLLVCSSNSSTADLLEIVQSGHESSSLQVSRTLELSLPPTFQPTAFVEMNGGKLVVLGSRSGDLVIYYNVFHENERTNQIAPAISLRHIHGSDTVTQLQQVAPTNSSEQDTSFYEILSTGRDGSYAVHRITSRDCETGSKSPILCTLHRSYPPFGPNVEGASFVMADSGGTQLLLYGFRGKDFVVWNESTHSEVMCVPCGGAHRSWAYCSRTPSQHLGKTNQGGCFIWTKAGVCNIAKFDSPAHNVLQPGGHGREIKAMALYKPTSSQLLFVGSIGWLIATGAEDTAIRLWVVKATGTHARLGTHNVSAREKASCVRVLRKHTTGIQHLSFCKDFLFSSAGCEEFFIWKINFCVSTVGIGTVLQAAVPKHTTDSDLRITSFEVVCISDNPKADSVSKVEHFLIYAVYSNSMVRVFKYTDDPMLMSEDRFRLLGKGFYNTTCLTQICSLGASFPWFLTASTNGAVTIWPGGDHHAVVQERLSKLAHRAEHHIHQNAILALQATHVGQEHHLLLTGGDDNALGITVLPKDDLASTLAEQPGNCSGLPSPRFGTLLIPRAHAAAITALEILDSKESDCIATFTVLSSGNDQRLKIWGVTVDLEDLIKVGRGTRTQDHTDGPALVRSIDVELLGEMWTSVADASSMVVMPDAGGWDTEGGTGIARVESGKGKRLMIAGIGMEMMRIDSTS